MVEYIVQIANGILGFVASSDTEQHRNIVSHCMALAKEMQNLDPRDFLPEARYEFVVTRLDVEKWASRWQSEQGISNFLNNYIKNDQKKGQAKQLIERTIAVLNKYGGEGWRVKTRQFTFIKDTELRKIIERDYKELILVLFPGGAWKSTVIMAGSILEAILFDLLSADPGVKAKALASPEAPKGDMEKWQLEKLIDVATALKIMPENRKKTFDQVMRHYRNFVHPKREVKEKHPCREGEAQLAVGGLNAFCDILENP